MRAMNGPQSAQPEPRSCSSSDRSSDLQSSRRSTFSKIELPVIAITEVPDSPIIARSNSGSIASASRSHAPSGAVPAASRTAATASQTSHIASASPPSAAGFGLRNSESLRQKRVAREPISGAVGGGSLVQLRSRLASRLQLLARMRATALQPTAAEPLDGGEPSCRAVNSRGELFGPAPASLPRGVHT